MPAAQLWSVGQFPDSESTDRSIALARYGTIYYIKNNILKRYNIWQTRLYFKCTRAKCQLLHPMALDREVRAG